MALQLPSHRTYAGNPDGLVVQVIQVSLSMSAPSFFRLSPVYVMRWTTAGVRCPVWGFSWQKTSLPFLSTVSIDRHQRRIEILTAACISRMDA